MHHNSSPRRSRVSKIRKSDLFLVFSGLALASVSAYFPYYVYNNTDEFGPPRMAFTGRSELELEAQTRNELIQLAATGSRVVRNDTNKFGESVDPITTGSIAPPQQNQELKFKLVFATSGHALIKDGEDIIPISRGSRLPDGSMVKSVRQRKGQWQIVTSNNVILTMKN